MCPPDAGLALRTQIFALHRMYSNGAPPRELEGLDGPPEAWSFYCDLKPAADSPRLSGVFRTENLTTQVTVTIDKRPALA